MAGFMKASRPSRSRARTPSDRFSEMDRRNPIRSFNAAPFIRMEALGTSGSSSNGGAFAKQGAAGPRVWATWTRLVGAAAPVRAATLGASGCSRILSGRSEPDLLHQVSALAQGTQELLHVLRAASLERELEGGVAEARGEGPRVVHLDHVGAAVRDDRGHARELARPVPED